MRLQILAGVILLCGVVAFGTSQQVLGQNKGKWGFQPKGGDGQPKFGDGQQKGGFGGFTFNPLDMLAKDPGKSFDWRARGKATVLISDFERTKAVHDELVEYAKKNNITNGEITRDQFTAFGQDVKARLDNGTLKSAPMTFNPQDFKGTIKINKDGAAPQDTKKPAETEFKRLDANADGFLNMDEMPEPLKADLGKWDKNSDRLIDLDEFTAYFTARSQTVTGTEKGLVLTIVIIDEDELDRRPVLFRAGKLPKELPKWFTDLDTDKDGQVALWEWRAGGKDMDEFNGWDTNEDGFITAEEVLRRVHQQRIASKKSGADSEAVASATPPAGENPQANPGGNFRFPQFGQGGGNPFGGRNGEDRKGKFGKGFKKGE